MRTTISLPRAVMELAEKYRELHPEENLSNFSDVVARALIHYAERHHPQLLMECIAEVRAGSPGRKWSGGVRIAKPGQDEQQQKNKKAG